MVKLLLVYLLVTLSIALTTNATTYIVGGTSGWDISSDLESWAQNKVFNVGDTLVFQYSSSDSVCEVKRKSFKACNTSNSLNTFSNGNRTVQLTQPGKRYFISGNKLYCLGGMKLQVIVEGDASSPISSPEAQPEGNLPRTSLKAKNAPSDFSNSSEFSYGRRGSLLVAFLGFMATILWVV
ncbi:blue copper protein-like [Mangifera indica]|uniref:blue copper protein-like n=1 Tax=Mangifera indica TaxID=29780 RepID=UPI001CFA1C75|nr:blue copper protein-like [Mangifera indica]